MNDEQVARLQRALDHVTTHPLEWAQHYYLARTPCGTMACLAGRVVLDEGGWIPEWSACGTDTYSTTWVERDGTALSVGAVATGLLGLTRDQAEDLFASANSLRELWVIAEEASDWRLKVPDPLPDWADVQTYSGAPVRPTVQRWLDAGGTLESAGTVVP